MNHSNNTSIDTSFHCQAPGATAYSGTPGSDSSEKSNSPVFEVTFFYAARVSVQAVDEQDAINIARDLDLQVSVTSTDFKDPYIEYYEGMRPEAVRIED